MRNFGVDGVAFLTVNHSDGTCDNLSVHNLVVKGGIDFICDAIANPTRPNNMSVIKVGGGGSSTTDDMTALESVIASKNATYSHTVSTNEFTLSAHFEENSATGCLKEAGVFNSDDVMLDRVSFNEINLDDDDTLTITFKFKIVNYNENE